MKHLTSGEKNVYLALLVLGSATQKQLIDFLGVDKSNISKITQNLIHKDYLTLKENHLFPNYIRVGSQPTEVGSQPTEVGSQPTPPKKTTPLSSPPSSSLRLSLISPPIIPPEKEILITNGHSGRMTAPATPNDPVEFSLSSDEVELQAQSEAYLNQAFDAFWKVYPRKVKKQTAKEKYLRIVKKGVDPNIILEGVKRARKEWALEEKQFIPHPSTWLNQSRWEDDLELDPTLEAEAPLEPIKPKRTATPATALQLFQPTYSKDEELFLKEYGKRPRDVHEEAAFHRAFATALEDIKDPYLLANCAKVAVEDMRYKEGDTTRLRRPHIWLDDRAYNDTMNHAKSLPRYTTPSTIEEDLKMMLVEDDEALNQNF